MPKTSPQDLVNYLLSFLSFFPSTTGKQSLPLIHTCDNVFCLSETHTRSAPSRDLTPVGTQNNSGAVRTRAPSNPSLSLLASCQLSLDTRSRHHLEGIFVLQGVIRNHETKNPLRGQIHGERSYLDFDSTSTSGQEHIHLGQVRMVTTPRGRYSSSKPVALVVRLVPATPSDG